MTDFKLRDGRRRVSFTSDWHLFHKNVLEFDKRPFRDLDHMHETLIANFNALVGPEDLTYFLGDMGLGKGTGIAEIIARLNGTKILVLGNHDKGATAMHRMGFDVVLNTASIALGMNVITMSHCPLRGLPREDVTGMRGAQPGENWHGEHKHHRFSLPDFGQFHLHGHTHKGPEERIDATGRQWDVGVKANGYRPVSLKQIESWIARAKGLPETADKVSEDEGGSDV